MTITIKKIKILKRIFEQNHPKNFEVTILYMTGKKFAYYEIVT